MDEKLNPREKYMGPQRILVTGFEPFGTHDTNPSQDVALRLQGTHQISDSSGRVVQEFEITTRILSVDHLGATETSNAVRSGEKWDAILHIGLCASCEHPRLEQRAQDVLDMRIQDNSGRMEMSSRINGRGHLGSWMDLGNWMPESFSSYFDISLDAGSFVCNETYYHTLFALQSFHEGHLPPPCLFLHIPSEDILDIDTSSLLAMQCLEHMLPSSGPSVVEVVAALIRDENGRVLLAQRSDDATWEFPGGKCEPGERWDDSIVRELSEELSIQAKAERIVGTWEHLRNDVLLRIHLVHCTMDKGPLKLDPLVHADVKWYNPSQPQSLTWTGRDGEMMEYVARYESMPR